MAIIAIDITNKEFKRALRGYNIDEVDEFLDQIASDYEALNRENSNLKDKLQSIQEKVEHYNKMETTIQNTLLLAQNASDQAKENAKKESELIIKSANETSKRIIDKSHGDVLAINSEYDKVKQEFIKFRSKYRNFMESQLEMFDDMEKTFIKNYNIGCETNEVSDGKSDDKKLVAKEIESVPKQDEISTNDNELDEIKNFFIKG